MGPVVPEVSVRAWLWVYSVRASWGRTCWARAAHLTAAREGVGRFLFSRTSVVPPFLSVPPAPHILTASTTYQAFTIAHLNLGINCAWVSSSLMSDPSTLLPAPFQPFQTKVYGAGFKEVLIMCHSERGSGTPRCQPFRVQTGWNWLPCYWLVC